MGGGNWRVSGTGFRYGWIWEIWQCCEDTISCPHHFLAWCFSELTSFSLGFLHMASIALGLYHLHRCWCQTKEKILLSLLSQSDSQGALWPSTVLVASLKKYRAEIGSILWLAGLGHMFSLSVNRVWLTALPHGEGHLPKYEDDEQRCS